ncbi:MAG: UDP-N-acetylglucosamine 2-epimerase (non-hydrolyzing) [Porticoccus sp.]|nr:UDP-N-acetylglucosamine 2-epimerase (non-hydrolyzing) [Porticoccus sp.]
MTMKLLTIFGTRPELIRLSLILRDLDKYTNNITVHTGQNYDFELDGIFLKELEIRKPDYYLNSQGTFAEQISNSFTKIEKILKKEKPDKLLVLGDTNSSLTSIIAKRLHIPIYHIEAGNRSFNPFSPEEINRKIIDHSADLHMVYSNRSFNHLKKEGIKEKSIFIVGNPIFEVLNYYNRKINKSKILNRLKIKRKKYISMTLHREENVDNLEKLKGILDYLKKINNDFNMQIIWPIHPRSKVKFNNLKLKKEYSFISLIKPLGFFDYVKLQKNSFLVITDSGTVQEECSINKIPQIILRDSTERDETLESGSGLLVNNLKSYDYKKLNFIISNSSLIETPREYVINNTSYKIINLLLNDFKIF